MSLGRLLTRDWQHSQFMVLPLILCEKKNFFLKIFCRAKFYYCPPSPYAHPVRPPRLSAHRVEGKSPAPRSGVNFFFYVVIQTPRLSAFFAENEVRLNGRGQY